MKLETVPVWKQVTPELTEEVAAFWLEHGAITTKDEAHRRAQELICVLRDESNALQGVGTAVLQVRPRLRQPMYYFRQFFAAPIRGRRQFVPFFQSCKQVLQEYNAGLATPESLGILIELENGKIAKAYPHVYEPDFDAVFLGYSPRGREMRAAYFENAKLLPPAPIRLRGAPNRIRQQQQQVAE